MKTLVIDIKDGYAVLAAGGDFERQFFAIEFDEADFAGKTGSPASLGLFELAGDDLRGLYAAADEAVLLIPMRFSLVKPISIDRDAIEITGPDFLSWEASQQLPDELGNFQTGFYELRRSFDNKTIKYMFYASARDFVDVLADFASHDSEKKLRLESEAIGLFNAANAASESRGVSVAIALEHDGASVVIADDGDFLAGRFIPGDNLALGQEIMYYIFANIPETEKPKALVCGDLNHLDYLGKIDWADRLDIPEGLGLSSVSKTDDPLLYVAAAGIDFLIKEKS